MQGRSNVPGNVALGAVYLNPKTDKRSNSDITESFEHFFDEATTASLNFTNVLMMGDFNAHIGDLSEFTDEHYDIQGLQVLTTCSSHLLQIGKSCW